MSCCWWSRSATCRPGGRFDCGATLAPMRRRRAASCPSRHPTPGCARPASRTPDAAPQARARAVAPQAWPATLTAARHHPAAPYLTNHHAARAGAFVDVCQFDGDGELRVLSGQPRWVQQHDNSDRRSVTNHLDTPCSMSVPPLGYEHGASMTVLASRPSVRGLKMERIADRPIRKARGVLPGPAMTRPQWVSNMRQPSWIVCE